MAWEIRWTKRALRDIAQLDNAVAKRILAKIEQTSSDPDRYFLRLKGSDDRKLRVGDYRVIAMVAVDREVLFVSRVGHRSTVYRRP